MNSRVQFCEALLTRLMGLRDADTGVWSGELASSALSTALAAIALAGEDEAHNRLAADGAAWLVAHANPDGGWGDTSASPSNLSTSLISRAALRALARRGLIDGAACEAVMAQADAWLAARLKGRDAGADRAGFG